MLTWMQLHVNVSYLMSMLEKLLRGASLDQSEDSSAICIQRCR